MGLGDKMLKNYSSGSEKYWSGRVDSKTDYNSFRWHQWIEFIDLNDESIYEKPFDGPLGFAILGFESDSGIDLNKGRVGASKGPKAIRASMSNLPCSFEDSVKLFDAGNIYVGNSTLSEAQESLGEAVDRILDLNLFPILIGGGHEIAFGHYQGLFKHFMELEEKPKIGVINFDAHFDFRPFEEVGSSGTMFRQIKDLNEENGIEFSYMVLGIQKHSNTVDLFDFAKKSNTEYIMAKDMNNRDFYMMFEKIDDFIRDKDHIYITICSDVFSTSFAPGVSAPQPLGIDPEKVIKLLRYILSTEKVISFDIAEVSPRFDQDNTTASLASVLIYALVNKVCEMYDLNIEI